MAHAAVLLLELRFCLGFGCSRCRQCPLQALSRQLQHKVGFFCSCGQHLITRPLLNLITALCMCRRPIHWRQSEPCPHHRPLCGVCLQRRHLLLLHLCGVLWWCAGCWHGHLPVWPCTCGPHSARQGWRRHELSSRCATGVQLVALGSATICGSSSHCAQLE
jgi:hypothetical protein